MDHEPEIRKRQFGRLDPEVGGVFFWLLFPGFWFGYAYSIKLGLIMFFASICMLWIHYLVSGITQRLDKIIEHLPDKRR